MGNVERTRRRASAGSRNDWKYGSVRTLSIRSLRRWVSWMPVTAATFQHALERDLSPKQASYFGATFLNDIQGASGYKGLPAHVSGIKVNGDQLVITLTEKDAGFLSKVATPFACAIPKDTPVNPKGVQSIAGVNFSRPATVNCGVIGPLDDWVQHRVQPAAQQSFGENVVGVDVAASYACRARDNEYGARMSEHGFGNAIDISGFTLESGRKITVREGWRGEPAERDFLSQVRRDACGDFHTVLGPGTPHHGDHFHLDLANRRSGKAYCT